MIGLKKKALLLLTFLATTTVVLGEKVLLGTTTTTVALGDKTESASTQNLIDWIRKQGGIYIEFPCQVTKVASPSEC